MDVILKNISKSYDGRTALKDVNLSIKRGERVVIFGPSGCGKSTLLRIIAGLLPPDYGEVWIGGNIASKNGKAIIEPRRRNVGMVFQELALWPHMSVREHLKFVLKARRVPRSEMEERIRKMLNMMNLNEYADARPPQLSGGQQQRLALARALIVNPAILLLDEPLSSLDIRMSLKLRREILSLHERLRFSMIYVTHSRDEALQMGSRIVLMKEGTVEKIIDREEAKEFFENLFREMD